MLIERRPSDERTRSEHFPSLVSHLTHVTSSEYFTKIHALSQDMNR